MSAPGGREEAKPIGDVLKALLRQKKFLQKGKYSGLTQAWAELVGTAISARTRIRGFQEGVVTVEVSSSVLLHELSGFMKPQLLSGLRASKGGRDVADLKFCLGNGAGNNES